MFPDRLVPGGKTPAWLDIVGQSEAFCFEEPFFSCSERMVDPRENGRYQQVIDLCLFNNAIGRRFHEGDVFFEGAGNRFFARQPVEVALEQVFRIVGKGIVFRVAHGVFLGQKNAIVTDKRRWQLFSDGNGVRRRGKHLNTGRAWL